MQVLLELSASTCWAVLCLLEGGELSEALALLSGFLFLQAMRAASCSCDNACLVDAGRTSSWKGTFRSSCFYKMVALISFSGLRALVLLLVLLAGRSGLEAMGTDGVELWNWQRSSTDGSCP